MKKLVLILSILFSLNSFSQNQQVLFGNNGVLNRSEWYRPNSPTNNVGNREVVGFIKAYDVFNMEMDTVRFSSLLSSRNDGTPSGFVWSDSYGNLKHSPSSELLVPFSQITSKPTTLAGYGITDAYLLPDQTGNSGKYLKTNGTSVEWSNTENQTITLTGDVVGSGQTGITTTLSNTGVSAGGYGYVVVDSKGRVTSGKRLEPLSGTTNSSGEYSYTYTNAYSTVPNVQPVIRNQSNDKQFIMLTSSTTSGFTIKVVQRNSINIIGVGIVLLETVSNVNGATVDIIVTEK